MEFSNRLTAGLAWAGLLVIVAVPTADFITSRFAPATSLTVEPQAQPAAAVVPVEAAEVAPKPQTRPAPKPQTVASLPATPPAADVPAKAPVTRQVAVKQVDVVEIREEPGARTAAADPTDRFLASGKTLPSYISDGEAPSTANLSDELPGAVAEEEQITTASVPPANQPSRVIPATGVMEAPASEPQTTAATDPQQGTGQGIVEWYQPGAATANQAAPVPMPASMRPRPSTAEPSLVGQERPGEPMVVEANTRPVRPVDAGPVPPAPVGETYDEQYAEGGDVVTAEDLEDWEYGPLSDFLEQRARQRRGAPPNTLFEDGAFLRD